MGQRKGFTIAVSGKGGVGKTMASSLLVSQLSKIGSVLAVDADPDANLAEALGIKVNNSVGQMREHLLQERSKRNASNRPFQETLEVGFSEIIVETPNFDVVVMGQPEEEGCYCAVNHVLRHLLDTRSRQYDFVVIDCEAGLEHLSRRTTRGADILLVVSDTSMKGLLTARRVAALAEQLGIETGRTWLLLNRLRPNTRPDMEEVASQTGLPLVGMIPNDTLITDFDELGRPLVELPQEVLAVQEIKMVIKKILGRQGEG